MNSVDKQVYDEIEKLKDGNFRMNRVLRGMYFLEFPKKKLKASGKIKLEYTKQAVDRIKEILPKYFDSDELKALQVFYKKLYDAVPDAVDVSGTGNSAWQNGKVNWDKEREDFAVMVLDKYRDKNKDGKLSSFVSAYYAKYNFPNEWSWDKKKAYDYVKNYKQNY